MNERINELVVQSGNGQIHNGKLYPHIGSRTQEDWQKFAELIVRECVWQVVKDNEVPQNIQVLIGERFKQHFGVEE